mmetsp:Transcript_69509/g.214859  ORF Transcript_69509/g.214859 Transcript_69509/m.214859 type:complete len:207 (+) Transcript_69509:100-720(+)
MASTSAASLLLAAGLLGLAAPCRAGGWQATAEDVETSLIGELAGVLRSGGPHRLEPALRPVYDAARKDALGNLEPEVALSALGRAFTERAGWSVKGLEAGGAPGFSAPARLQQLLAERMGGQGFGLRELAVLAGSLEDLARKEVEARLTRRTTPWDCRSQAAVSGRRCSAPCAPTRRPTPVAAPPGSCSAAWRPRAGRPAASATAR